MSSAMKFRLSAFLIHLVFSILLACISMGLVFLVWYPHPLAKAIGVTHIYFMMLGIDVVLGPLLTLIVAKQGKKSLKFDLMVIVLVQLIALGYGVYNIAITRPSYIAFDRLWFEVVQQNSMPKEDIAKAKPQYQQQNWLSPKWISVIAAKDDAELNRRTFVEVQEGISPSMQPSLYEPISNQWNAIGRKSQPLSELYNFNTTNKVDQVLIQYPQAKRWLPLKTNNIAMVVLLDNTHIVAIVDLRPWK